jgi:hypothetical protein
LVQALLKGDLEMPDGHNKTPPQKLRVDNLKGDTMKKLVFGLVALAMAVGLSNCTGGGGVGGGSVFVETTWYDFYGVACGSLRPGCSYKDN